MTVKSNHEFRMGLIGHIMLNPVDDQDVMFDLVWGMLDRCKEAGIDFSEIHSKAVAAYSAHEGGGNQ